MPEKKAEKIRVTIIPIRGTSIKCSYTEKDTNSCELQYIMANVLTVISLVEFNLVQRVIGFAQCRFQVFSEGSNGKHSPACCRHHRTISRSTCMENEAFRHRIQAENLLSFLVGLGITSRHHHDGRCTSLIKLYVAF